MGGGGKERRAAKPQPSPPEHFKLWKCSNGGIPWNCERCEVTTSSPSATLAGRSVVTLLILRINCKVCFPEVKKKNSLNVVKGLGHLSMLGRWVVAASLATRPGFLTTLGAVHTCWRGQARRYTQSRTPGT